MVSLHGTILRPVSASRCEVLRNGTVRIGDDGRIEKVEGGADSKAGDGRWILPGFVDAHLHLPQWDRRGIDGMTLPQWQERVGFPAEARLADAERAEALAEQFVSGLIAHGTTTAVAFGSPFAAEVDRSFAVFARRGIRMTYGMMLNDTGVPAELTQVADQALDASKALAAKWHAAEEGRLRYAFSPRSTIHCSEEMLRGAATLSEMMGCVVQTHVAESLEEMASVRQRFPESVDEIDLFAEMGLLTDRTILAHGVFLSSEQRKQVAATGTALVHCPTANLFRESGLMDYVAHRDAGIPIALGSSVAGGFDSFMPRVAVETMQTAKGIKVHTLPRTSHRVPSPAEAWWLATRGGAEAVGLGDEVGALEAGFQGDCLVVKPEAWIEELREEQQVSALLYTLRRDQIIEVYVAGRRV